MAERDIGFLGVMGWGLMLPENSSAVVSAAAVTGRGGVEKKSEKKSSQNWACLVWKFLMELVRVFCTYLEAPSSHIVKKLFLLKIWYFIYRGPSLLSADAGLYIVCFPDV